MKFLFRKWACLLFVILAVFLVSIHLYTRNLSAKSKNGLPRECSDVFNKTLFRLELRLCLWNGVHIILFFFLCVILEPASLLDHVAIFGVGVAWFLLQMLTNRIFPGGLEAPKGRNCPDVSYPNVMVPKLDDFVYNTLGQLCYIVVALPVVINN